MLFLRVIAWCGDEKFSLKKSCFYLYIRRKDNDDQDGIRPASISVQLMADGKAVDDKVTLDAEGKWSKTWTGLPKNNKGTEIKYTVMHLPGASL